MDPAAARALADAAPIDAFATLGPHAGQVRVFLPGAVRVEALTADGGSVGLSPGAPDGLFIGPVDGPYRLRIYWPGAVQETEDPYAFGLLLGDLDLHLIGEGRHFALGDCLGSHAMTIDGVPGVRFAVWAPNARRVAVVGDFNSWDDRRHPMRLRHGSGVWELFIPRLAAGERYKYAILGADGGRLPLKADPVATRTEMPPSTASVVPDGFGHDWQDDAWMTGRAARHRPDAAISIYELHAQSWLHGLTDDVSWNSLARHLIPHVQGLGFTHIELLPVAEHPFGGSWGYQPLGLFAPTARLGPPEDFAAFVDACHAAGVGVIVDWVPAHFPTDPHGLARFDGTALYEHADPREGFHQDWNTLIYNFGRNEVQGFLIASAIHWLERFHLDGLRVDAVASMLYRDYSRAADQWVPNVHGGRENLEAIGFLRHLNAVVGERCPGAMMIAEESTAWPGVTRPIGEGGLGFDYKWNMGWMHDTLHYMARDPIHRRHHHHEMTFGMVYAFSERFLLPLSHDEVVHGKGSLIGRMPGDRWRRFANLRAYYAFMWAHPGKKLVFMGAEFAQEREWNHDGALDRALAGDPLHGGVQRLLGDLNRLYRDHPALHARDSEPAGFDWVVGDDAENAVFAFLRRGDGDGLPVLVVANMTPLPRAGYRIGVPLGGRWREVLNSDAGIYGGSGMGNHGAADCVDIPSHGHAQSLELTLPPLAVLYLQPEGA
ncbi:1,4-alpha-glucan branching protein GlgB [Allostella humosa]|uniref:1,4-alpha-glucan branching protein GlgB n=1 Tax=Stella humosa TaxID=94 RepID=UPI003B8349C8